MYLVQQPNVRGQTWQAVFLFLDPAYDPGPESLGPFYQSQTNWLIRGNIPDLLQQVPAEAASALNVLRPLAATERLARAEAHRWRASLQEATDFDEAGQQKLIALLTQFMVQRFMALSAKEIEAMLKLTPIEETRAGQDIFQRGVTQGLMASLKRVLERRFGPLPVEMEEQLSKLTAVQLEQALDEALTAVDLTDFTQRLTTIS